MSEQLQLSLPYKEIKSVMGRKYYRDNFDISSKESYKIPVEVIKVRDGYNKRRVYEDMENAVIWVKSSTAYGIVELDPLPVIEITDEGEVFILRGHRRLEAVKMAIAEGLEVEFVVCTPANKGINEFDRVIDIYTSNMHQSKLKPLEQAEVVFDAKHNFGKISNEEIGKKLNVSRQTVDNLLLIAEASDDVKNEIKVGNMSFTDAVAFVRAQRKQSKEADKKEEDSHKTQASVNLEPEDSLKEEMQELAALDEQADDYMERQKALEQREQQLLEERANEVLVNKEALEEQKGKRLAANAVLHYQEQMLDDNSGELVPIDAFKIWSKQGTEIDDLFIEEILKTTIQSVWIFKTVTIAESVITELPAEREKDKYDSDRPEIAWIQNGIKLNDRISVRVEKLPINEQDMKDLTDFLKWQQKDLLELREWVHSNKKQNKRDR